MKDSPVLQKDIADALGISVNTVSHALRGLKDISEETTIKVKEKAKELGYIPNSNAIRLKTGSNKVVALVYDNLTNPYFTIMASKLFGLIKERGYDTLIYPCKNYFKLDAQVFNDLVALQVDGILSFLDFDEKIAETKVFKYSNIVLVGRLSKHDITSIYTDDYEGGKLVGEYLKSKGHKKVLYAGLEQINESSKRCQGLNEIFKNNELEKIQFLEESDPLEVSKYIEKEHITAVFGFNDVIATKIQKALQQTKLNVEVVGYDAIHKYLSFVDEITSVQYDFDKIASLATENLFEKIEGNSSVRKIKLPVSLYFAGGE